jgi:membrane associated rhomboid family serine protease
MEQIKLTTNEAILYIALFNIGLGILFGLVPLIFGFIRKERSYAVFGFLGSIIGGALLGVFLSIPVAAIFTWLILRRPKNEAAEGVATNQSPTDVTVENSENR